MRAYPSAAPEQTPSKRPRTPRMRGTRSSAATKRISEVPGFMRHRSTSLASRVLRRHSAPSIGVLFIRTYGAPLIGLRPRTRGSAPLLRVHQAADEEDHSRARVAD